MRIHNLEVENIKRIKIARIDPKKNVVVLEGRNEQGKTSLMDSICYLLGGEKLIPENPIRAGETRAEIKAEIDGMQIRRWWKKSKTYLEIKQADGKTPGKPQTFLNSLIGDLSFDPLKFITQDRGSRIEMLREISGLDFTGFNVDLEEAVENRKLYKRQLKDLEGQATALEDIQDPGEVEDIKALTEEYNRISEHNKKQEYFRREIEKCASQLQGYAEQMIELENSIVNRREEMADLKKDLEDLIDLGPITEKMKAAQDRAGQAERFKRKKDLQIEIEAKEKAIETEQDTIDDIREKKEKALSEANMPIDGLTFGIDDVEYNGVEFSEISQAQKIKVSMAIAMAQNPKLKVIRILDGSLLDEDSMIEIEKLAEKFDFQVFIERVGPTKAGETYYIEEGRIKDV